MADIKEAMGFPLYGASEEWVKPEPGYPIQDIDKICYQPQIKLKPIISTSLMMYAEVNSYHRDYYRWEELIMSRWYTFISRHLFRLLIAEADVRNEAEGIKKAPSVKFLLSHELENLVELMVSPNLVYTFALGILSALRRTGEITGEYVDPGVTLSNDKYFMAAFLLPLEYRCDYLYRTESHELKKAQYLLYREIAKKWVADAIENSKWALAHVINGINNCYGEPLSKKFKSYLHPLEVPSATMLFAVMLFDFIRVARNIVSEREPNLFQLDKVELI